MQMYHKLSTKSVLKLYYWTLSFVTLIEGWRRLKARFLVSWKEEEEDTYHLSLALPGLCQQTLGS